MSEDRIAVAGLPMAHNLVFNSITPPREYDSFGQDIDNRWAALGHAGIGDVFARPEPRLPSLAVTRGSGPYNADRGPTLVIRS